ncbi:hypothetical protein BS47DRAFT_1358147 [Hydnum rufescens UP504]|uniref:Uncharacterized protein n=1 Tax=Hydnum rufescens UP504 TaxID=1448309 RepID=A0A9P6B859_9AGAM|nr:hypothetical protein BS47DRAFT_1358147 [Hydnum rufescens UP504]
MYWICVYWVSILFYLCLIEASEVIELGFCDAKILQKAPEGFRRHEAYASKAQNKDHAYFGSQASKPSEVSEPILGFPDLKGGADHRETKEWKSIIPEDKDHGTECRIGNKIHVASGEYFGPDEGKEPKHVGYRIRNWDQGQC